MRRIILLGGALALLAMCGDATAIGPRGGGGGGRGGGGARPGGGGGGGRAPNMAANRPAPQMQRPGGGARPGMGPAQRPQMQRPQMQQRPNMGQMQRPNLGARPGGGQIQRPNIGQAQRPNLPANRPGMVPGQRPNLPQVANRPAIQPGGGGINRPAIQPGGGFNRPTQLPSGIGNRPNIGGGGARPSLPISPTRPGGGGAGIADRPAIGGGGIANRPNIPTTRPGGGMDRPVIGGGGIVNRPGAGGGGTQWPNRPGGGGGINDRPNIPTTRPGGGLDRPVINRPGAGGGGEQWPNRPGGGGQWPNRPGGGGSGTQWPNRPGGGGNRPWNNDRPWNDNRPWNNNRPWNDNRPWNNNRPWNDNRPIVNRPINTNITNNTLNSFQQNNAVIAGSGAGWGGGYGGYGALGAYAPYYGFHSGWYDSGWNNWGYAPATWLAGSAALGWASGVASDIAYSNPYFVAPQQQTVVVQGMDYSQPLPPPPAAVQQTVVLSDTEPVPPVAATPSVTPPSEPPPPPAPKPPDDPKIKAAMVSFDIARDAFKRGDYIAAQKQVEQSISGLPGDPVMHEFRALTLFAQKKYPEAAAAVYAVLSAGPGMSWDTLKSLYPDVETYTKQLKDLEQYVKDHPNEPDAKFLLAYHSLTLEQPEAAIPLLEDVVKLQPKDQLSAQILKALKPPPQEEAKPAAKTG